MLGDGREQPLHSFGPWPIDASNFTADETLVKQLCQLLVSSTETSQTIPIDMHYLSLKVCTSGSFFIFHHFITQIFDERN